MKYLQWLACISIVILAVIFATGCAPSDSAVKTQADQMNAGLAPAIMQQPDLNAYLQAIGDRVVAAAKQLDSEHVGPPSHFKADSSWMFTDHIQFHLVNSKTINAFTTGGDHVYVYNELFQKCQNEDELAAVMAHEFGHIYCRHVQAGQKRQQELQGAATGVGLLGAAAGAGGGGGSDYADSATKATLIAGQFIGMGFTRGDEDQADEFGFQFYCRAGWDPNAFANFFQTMITMGFDTTPTMMSDHPKLADRVARTKKRAADFNQKYPTDPYRKPEIASVDQFVHFRSIAADVAQHTPDDSSLAKAQQLLDAFPSCVAHTESDAQVKAKQSVAQQTGLDTSKTPDKTQPN